MRSRSRQALVCAIVSGAALVGVASGQTSAEAQPKSAEKQVDPEELASILSPDPSWTVQIEPSFWYVSPSGKVKLPVNSGTGGAGFTTPGDSVRVDDLNLDTPRFEPSGEIHLSSGRWRVTFSGADYSLDRHDTVADSSFRLGSVVVAPGDTLDVDFHLTTVELTAGYRVWGRVFSSPEFTEKPENAVESLARVYVIGGARIYDVGFDVARTSGAYASADADEFFGEPIVGIRIEADLARNFTLDAQVTGGGLPAGDTTSYSVDIQAGFQWRPHPNVGVQIGYRQLAYWLSDGSDEDEFSYDGRLAGLFAGLVIRF
jgi:hypothetical protein